MRFLLLSGFLLFVNTEDLAKWRPGVGRDISQFQLILPHPPALDVLSSPGTVPKTFHPNIQFRPGNRSFEDVCGYENPEGVDDRIVGGHEAKRHQWPWMVALFIDDHKFCGGTLISDEWVLTAAHCAEGAGYYDIMVGAHNVRAESEAHRLEIRAHEDYIHPSYNLPIFLHNDIALLKLPEKVPLSQYIRPACLPKASDADEMYEGEVTTPTGWGLTAETSNHISPQLQMVSDRPIMSTGDCQQFYGPLVYEGTLCIDTEGGRGICSGDSGGPLNDRMAGETNRWVQIGVTSFGGGDGCEDGSPHGFTRVAEHLQWIESVTGISLV